MKKVFIKLLSFPFLIVSLLFLVVLSFVFLKSVYTEKYNNRELGISFRFLKNNVIYENNEFIKNQVNSLFLYNRKYELRISPADIYLLQISATKSKFNCGNSISREVNRKIPFLKNVYSMRRLPTAEDQGFYYLASCFDINDQGYVLLSKKDKVTFDFIITLFSLKFKNPQQIEDLFNTYYDDLSKLKFNYQIQTWVGQKVGINSEDISDGSKIIRIQTKEPNNYQNISITVIPNPHSNTTTLSNSSVINFDNYFRANMTEFAKKNGLHDKTGQNDCLYAQELKFKEKQGDYDTGTSGYGLVCPNEPVTLGHAILTMKASEGNPYFIYSRDNPGFFFLVDLKEETRSKPTIRALGEDNWINSITIN